MFGAYIYSMWHTVRYGDEECRKTGAWHISAEPSFEAAINKARKLAKDFIVHAIGAGGETILNEQQLRDYLAKHHIGEAVVDEQQLRDYLAKHRI